MNLYRSIELVRVGESTENVVDGKMKKRRKELSLVKCLPLNPDGFKIQIPHFGSSAILARMRNHHKWLGAEMATQLS